MKRYGNLFEKIISIENLELADSRARRDKEKTYGVRKHDRNRASNLQMLNEVLRNKNYKTSKYHVFKIFEPKEREIYQLPYYPDRIVHHAIMNVLEPIWCSLFISSTFACIKKRGIQGAYNAVLKGLEDKENAIYCLKIDVRKYYPTIDHTILKLIVRRKIKCESTLQLLDEIIDSAEGVPIGNYLSQYFANVYLAYFDHWVKEELKIKHYYRYADDMVFMGKDKSELHGLLIQVNHYFTEELNIQIKDNYQVFPINKRGLDFVGYVFRDSHVLIRKSIKRNFAQRLSVINKLNLSEKQYIQQIAGWLGWAKYSNSTHFLKQNIKEEHYESIVQRTAPRNRANARGAHKI